MTIAASINSYVQPISARNRVIRLTIFSVAAGVLGALLFGWWSDPVSAWLALLLYGTFYILLLKMAPGSALALFPAFGSNALTQFISGILIESGGYLSETKEMGSATGGFLRLAVVYILFFGTSAAIIETFIEKWRRQGQIAAYIANRVKPFMPLAVLMDIVVAISLGYLVYVGAKNGFPLLTGVDRLDFLKDAEDPIYTSIMGNRSCVMAYLGIMLALQPKTWRYRFLSFFVLVVSALMGDKFTEYIVDMPLLFLPLLCRVAWSEKGLPLRKVMIMGLVLSCITMPLVFIVYGGLSNSSEGLDHMKDRMTLQGQLWFLADREVNDLVRFQEGPIFSEAKMMVAPEPTARTALDKHGSYQGMAWMLMHFAPPSDAYLRLKTGIVYVLGLHAYFLEITGWLGLLFLNFVFAGLVGLIASGILYSVIYGRLVHLLYFTKFLIFWISASCVADPFMLINWKSFLFLLSLWLYDALDRRFNPFFMARKRQ